MGGGWERKEGRGPGGREGEGGRGKGRKGGRDGGRGRREREGEFTMPTKIPCSSGRVVVA
jgi:hypothetical protein